MRISGVGARKAEDYGAAFLECIADFVAQTGAQPRAKTGIAPKPAQLTFGGTARRTLELLREGQTAPEIAAARGLALSTVEGHLAEAIESGELGDLDGLVDSERRRAIEAAIDEVGADRLAPIRDLLGADFSYGEIRFVRAARVRRQAPDDNRDE